MKNTYIFGASKLGKIALELLSDRYNIIGFIDNDVEKQGNLFQDLMVYSPNILIQSNYEVIIASQYADDIVAQLIQQNFHRYQIFNFSLVQNGLETTALINNHLKRLSTGSLLFSLGTELRIDNLSFLSGGSSILDYFFLKTVAARIKANSFLEIGTWTGESVATIAEEVSECYSISLPDSDQLLMRAFEEKNKDNFSRYFSRQKSNITHFAEDSRTFDFNQLPEHIDIVFIDGDHSYQAIYGDTYNIFNRFGFENTIVIWHDFKTLNNLLVNTTFNAVKAVIPDEHISNLFSVDNNLCGIYIPVKFQSLFEYDEKSDQLYSYQVTISPKLNTLM